MPYIDDEMLAREYQANAAAAYAAGRTTEARYWDARGKQLANKRAVSAPGLNDPESYVPTSRASFSRWLESLLHRELTDPVIGVQQVQTGTILIRIQQSTRPARYFRIKVSEER